MQKWKKTIFLDILTCLGDEVIPVKYLDALDFSEGLASVENANNKYGYINHRDSLVIPFNYDWGDRFTDSLAKIKINGKFGLIDLKGNIICPPNYDNMGDFSQGLVMLVQGITVGYCDHKGNVLVPLEI